MPGRPLQGVEWAPDAEGRRLVLSLHEDDGLYVWSLRISGTSPEAASAWHSLEPLRTLARIEEKRHPEAVVDITDDVALKPSGDPYEIDVVIAGVTFRTQLPELAHYARTLLARADREQTARA